MDEEENNSGMQAGSMEAGMGKVNAARQNIESGIANSVKGKAKELIKNKKIVRPDQKVRGKLYAAKGEAQKAAGRAKEGAGHGVRAAGMATHAAGTAARANAALIRGIGNALAATGVGAPAKAATEPMAQALDQAGKNAQQKGNKIKAKGRKIIKEGKKDVEAGEHNIKRGQTLHDEGKDIGDANGKGGSSGIPGIPGMPKLPGKISPSNVKNVIKKTLFNGKNFFFKTKAGLIILISIIALALILLLVLMVSGSIRRGKYEEGNWQNVPYVVSEQALKSIAIFPDGNGGYTYGFLDENGNALTIDENVERILKTLKDNGSYEYDDLGKNDDERKELLKALIQAEIATQYPDLRVKTTGERVSSGYSAPTSVTNASPSVQWGWLIQNELLNSYLYEHDLANMPYSDTYVNGYITEDKKNYIVVSNSTGLYAGQGVQIYSNETHSYNSFNLNLLKNHGVDTSNIKEGDLIDADITDKVSQEIFEYKKSEINNKAMAQGLTLSENQIVALVDISYLNGNVDTQIANIAQYGADSEQLANTSGFQSCGENDTPNTREQCVWKLFHYGKYEKKSQTLFDPSYFGGTNSSEANSSEASAESETQTSSATTPAESSAQGGQKDANGVIITPEGNIDFLNYAIDCHKLVREDKFYYNGCGRDLPITKGDSVHYIDCVAYISMALEVYGVTGWRYYPHQLTVDELDMYGQANFEKIYDGNTLSMSDLTDMRSGDIVVMQGHGQIFYGYTESGQPVWLNCGSNNAINCPEGQETGIDGYPSVLKVYRVPGGSGSTYSSKVLQTLSGGDENFQGNIKLKRKDSTGKETPLEYIDEATFDKMVSSNDPKVMNYYTLKKGKAGSSSNSITGGTSILSDFIASWENGNLLKFKHGMGSITDYLVQGYITEDGKEYICRTDEGTGNGTKNFGFGIMVNQNGRPNNVEYFDKYGIDITDPKYLQERVSTLPVELVDQVKADILEDKVKNIENVAANHGVTLSTEQIHALVGVAYQYGDAGAKLDNFMELYKQYGNTDALRSNYPMFVSVPGGTNHEGMSRADASWALFHNGEYHAGVDIDLNPSNYQGNSNTTKTVNSGNEASASTTNATSNSTNTTDSTTSTTSTTASTTETATTAGTQSSEVTSFNKFLFLGDSRYVGINSELSGLGSDVSVCAVSGSTAAQWQAIIDSGSGNVNGTTITLPNEASGVSVMLGANSPSQISELEDVLQKLHAKYPSAHVYFNSVYHVGSNYTYANKDDVNANYDKLNENLKTFCNSNSDWASYVDITEGLHDENGYLKYPDGEGIHLVDPGRAQLVTNIKSNLNGTSNNSTSSTTSEEQTNGASAYTIAIASYTSTTITTVETFSYIHTDVVSGNGTPGRGTQYSATPVGNSTSNTTLRYKTTNADYQSALKNHTLYFDFLWATYITSGDRKLVMEMANEAINSPIEITVYSDKQISQSSSSSRTQPRAVSTTVGNTTYVDYYDGLSTTTTVNTTVASKACVTSANVWNMEYENKASSYAEFKGKSKEKVREKIEEKDKIMKILRKRGKLTNKRADVLHREYYMLEEMLQGNSKVEHMIDIFKYYVEIARGIKKEKLDISMNDIINTSVFDLSSSQNSSMVKVLMYTSLNISDEEKQMMYEAVEKMTSQFPDNSENTQRKKYLTAVILNRALSSKFPDSVSGVLNQTGQFPNFSPSDITGTATVSDGTKSAVDSIIQGGDCSKYSVYVNTPSGAEKLNWDKKHKKTLNDGDGSDNSYTYYTDDEIIKELKKYEVSVTSSAMMATEEAKKIVQWAEAQVGKSTFYNKHSGQEMVSTNYCAAFVESAYYEAGLGYCGGNAIDIPHPNPIAYNADGTVNYSNIPVGACLVSQGVPVGGVAYGHVCLYVGNGYVIEAGGSTISKSTIEDSFAGKGHNCAPFLGWGFAMADQDEAMQRLVIKVNGASYGEGWTANDDATRIATGIEGYYVANGRQYAVYCQGGNDTWAKMPYSMGTYSSSACGATSVAIISSAVNSSITPIETGQTMYSAAGLPYGAHSTRVTCADILSAGLNSNGITGQWKKVNQQEVIDHLKSGQPVIYNVHNASLGNATFQGHYATLLGINEQGQIFLGDPAREGRNTGYYDPSQIFTSPSADVCLINY